MTDSAPRRLFRRLQALDDAIAYRRARLGHPCPDCRDGAHCDDHACDLVLLNGYEDDARATSEAIHTTRPRPGPGARKARGVQSDQVVSAGRYPPASGSVSGRGCLR